MSDSRRTPSKRPTRRTILIAGAAAGGIAAGGVATGSLVTMLRDRSGHAQPSASDDPSPSARPANIWEERDRRFLKPLAPDKEQLKVMSTFRGAFPSARLRDVLPLEGLGSGSTPWTAATIIGPENQLQITRSGETSPAYLLSIPAEKRGEILSMTWDRRLRTLYLSSAGRLWAWQHARPEKLTELADVPGARVLYELLVDDHGLVWGGVYPLGSVFFYNPAVKKIKVYSQLAADSEYVRRLSMDTSGQLWAGTGSQNPRLFTFHRSSPEDREEIAHPDPVENGFITALRAGPSKILMTSDGHPDIFELDGKSRVWGRRVDATGWVRPASGSIRRDDTFYMMNGDELTARTSETSSVIARVSLKGAQSIHHVGDNLLLAGPTSGGFSLQVVFPAQKRVETPRGLSLEPGRFKVQSLLAPADGNVYVGGFMAQGIAGIDPDTDQRWHSPEAVDVIDQIENMVEFGPSRVYLGTYSWADIISWDIATRDEVSSYERAVRLSTPYQQSRPFGLATNSTNLFVGTVPNYGLAGGVLAKIDVSTNTPEWVLDGEGAGFVEAHSIVGLVANDEYVYGTTSVRNGSGLPDTEGAARVFMVDIATRKKIWETEPVPDAGALYSPLLVAGWLLVADLEGINVIDPRNGRLEAQHRLGPDLNSSQRPGWASAEIAIVNDGRQIVHATAGAVSVADFLSARSARAEGEEFGTRVATSAAGRVFVPSHGTDVVEIATMAK